MMEEKQNEPLLPEDKQRIGQKVKALKTVQSQDEYLLSSRLIMQKVASLPEFIKAKTVLAYWSFGREVFTHDFIVEHASAKRFLLPSVDGDIMYIKSFDHPDSLIPGQQFSIPEPDGPLFTDYSAIDLVIVPGIAFDRMNNRMGRGKAYYDRFLKDLKVFKAGVCFPYQMFDEIPANDFDIKMDRVVTLD